MTADADRRGDARQVDHLEAARRGHRRRSRRRRGGVPCYHRQGRPGRAMSVHPTAFVGARCGHRPHRRAGPRLAEPDRPQGAHRRGHQGRGPHGHRGRHHHRGQLHLPPGVAWLRPQDLKFAGEDTKLVLGDENLVREFTTLHKGTTGGGGVTRIGNKNLFMANSHVAHDCVVGSGCVLANSVALAGHVQLGNHVIVGAVGGAPVHPVGRLRLHRRRGDGGDGRAALLHRAGRSRRAGRVEHRRPDAPWLQRRTNRPGQRGVPHSVSFEAGGSTRRWRT